MDEKKERPEDSPILAKIREMLAKRGAPISTDVNNMSQADKIEPPAAPSAYAEGGEVVDPLAGIKELLKKATEENRPAPQKTIDVAVTKPDLDNKDQSAKGVFMTKRFADGGMVQGFPSVSPEDLAALQRKASGMPVPQNDLQALQAGVAPLSSQEQASLQAQGVGGSKPSDEEKLRLVMEALGKNPPKMADGGEVDLSQLPTDAPQESKLQAILSKLGIAGSNLMNSPVGTVAGAALDPIHTLANIATNPTVDKAVGSVGNSVLSLDKSLAGVPAEPTATPPPAPVTPPPAPVSAPAMPPKPQAPVTLAPDPLAQLGKFDANAATAGFNPADRQVLANNLDKNQHTFGNYLAEAVAGLGDAVAAKGGVKQNSLGDIFGLQTQQRHEALENFDKARQAAVEHFNMKNQADQALINNLKARGELMVSPSIAQAIGHPELANKPLAQADLVIKTDGMKHDFANKMQERKQGALKNAADEIDKALTHGGVAGTQKAMDPQSRLRMIHSQAIKNDPEAFGYHITEGN